jgi:hypothetical protein
MITTPSTTANEICRLTVGEVIPAPDLPPPRRQTTPNNRGLRLLAIALALFCAACGDSREVLVAFRTEQQAQEHCPNDVVVWVDPQSRGYHLKGFASHGPANGRYACRGEAERAGMREMAN